MRGRRDGPLRVVMHVHLVRDLPFAVGCSLASYRTCSSLLRPVPVADIVLASKLTVVPLHCVSVQVLLNLPEDVPCHRSVSRTPVHVPLASPPLPLVLACHAQVLSTSSSHYRTATATAVPTSYFKQEAIA